jgi:hypothetical protein
MVGTEKTGALFLARRPHIAPRKMAALRGCGGSTPPAIGEREKRRRLSKFHMM